MARLWESGFETGTTEWNGASQSPLVQSSVKRTGNYACDFSTATASQTRSFRQVFDESETNLFGRFALRINSGASQNTWNLLRFHDENNALQFSIRYDGGTQTLSWFNGAGTRIGSLGNVLIPVDTWVVVEFAVVVDDAAGALTIKINGTTDSVFSGDTDYTDNGYVRSVYFGYMYISGTTNTWQVYVDDVAINNEAGSYQNSWVGLGGVYWLPPTADGYQNDWEPSTGSDNYAMVDEVPPNTTDYVQALDAADLDLYALTDAPDYVDRINLLRVMYRAAVTTAGSNDLRDVIRVDGVNHEGDTFTVVPLIPSFTLYTGPAYYLNPETSAAWEVAEVDALEAGFEIV